MIPDKIYIQQDMINNIPLEQKEFDDDEEYIRKEALLEWVKDALNNVDGINFEEDNYEAGLAHAYGMVISKLQLL